jgi:predicted nucleic acid-binding protein
MSDGFLLDTNVISEFNRIGRPNEHVRQWLDTAAPDSLYVSVITLAEIQFGIELLNRANGAHNWSSGSSGSPIAGLRADCCRSMAIS